ncbi:YfhO family protein [Lachnospiraceae bacterium OttesenSCG-928-D06]|nr:YfhO family protein [Lachnospiraceae bacterium OttesenSCG-928-D06]
METLIRERKKESKKGFKILPSWKRFEEMSGFLAFIIPTLIMLVLFMIRGIYPFGDRSFLFSDMYHQYMPFFNEFMEKIKAGEGLSYSYNVGIGSNFLALYIYYIASPTHWLSFLLPQEHLMEFMSYLTIVKIGLCGYTANIYLKKHFKVSDLSVLLFSCFYALSGFIAAYNWNIMWLDPVILFPLIVLGLERLVKEGKCTLYCITLTLCIFSNYYISIMICIFLVLYFIYLFLTEKRNLKMVCDFAIYSLLAGAMSAILLIPEVCAIIKTDFGSSAFPKEISSYFSILDVLARHCMNVTTERGLDHWPNIYCGGAVFLLIPLFALNGKIPLRRRFGLLTIAGFMLVSFSTNVLDFIWHGFNYPDSLPGRQSFIYIFLILIMCYEAFKHLQDVNEKHILYSYVAAVIFMLGCEKFIEHEDFTTGVEITNIVVLTIYGILLYFYRTRESGKWKRGLTIAAMLAVILESSINMGNTSVGTTSRSEYLEQEKDYKELLTLIKEEPEDGNGMYFYRIEKFNRKTKNDGTLTGYPTASLFSSTLNSHVTKMYENLGMRHSKVYYCFDGATALSSALLNVDYMFGEDGKEEGNMYRIIGNSEDVWLYESNYKLPFGYTAKTGYNMREGYGVETIKLQNRMIDDLGIEEELFEKIPVTENEEDVTFKAEESGYYYAQVNNFGTRKITGEFNDYTREYNDLKRGAILYLGYLNEGERVTLTNGDEEDDSKKITLTAYRMDEVVLRKALDILGETHLTNLTYDTTSLSGEITMKEAGRLILSIPYEAGYSIWLNGESVEPELFGGTLMAFDLEAGYYELVMKYVPEGRNVGIVVSLVAIIFFVLLTVMKNKEKLLERKK